MEYAQQHYDKVKAFSLPSMGSNAVRRHVELGVRGDPEQVAAAIEDVRRVVREMGFPFQDGPAKRADEAHG